MIGNRLKLEAGHWLVLAQQDITSAHMLLNSKKYDNAAFFAQQSAEKALKALWIKNGLNPWGNSLSQLFKELSGEDGKAIAPFAEIATLLEVLQLQSTYEEFSQSEYPEALAAREVGDSLAKTESLLEVVRKLFLPPHPLGK